MKLSMYIAALVFALLTNADGQGVAAAHAQQVTITVTAQHGDGTPFPDLWVVLLGDNPDAEPSLWLAQANADGLAQFVVEIPPESMTVFVKIAGRGDATLVPPEDRPSLYQQSRQVIPNYSFPTFLTIPLEVGVTEYATTITLYESVRVSVQLVDELGEPVLGGAMMQINGIGMETASNQGKSTPMSIGGIRNGGRAEIMILGPNSPKWKVVRLEPHQTLADVDIGPIHIPPYQSGTVPLHLTATGYGQLTTRAVEWLRGGVTVFSADGQSAIIFATDHTTGLVVDRPPQQEARTPMLDPGVYYLAPGSLGTTRADLLRRLLLDGVDVDTAGVPKITAIEGQSVTMTVDMAVAEKAILKAVGR